MAEKYKTKQRAVIETLLKEYCGEHLTAEEIVSILEKRGSPVGKATVYRCLEMLIKQGAVKKYVFGEDKSACYEYQLGMAIQHYHLKCSHCGELTHMECDFLDKLPEHVFEHHGFALDPSQIVMVGCCEKCAQKNKKDKQ